MKLTVEHLGRIRSAELDIRPLTVFAGENGTNKTWTAYCLYTLLQQVSLGGQRTEGFQNDPALSAYVTRTSAELRDLLKAQGRFEARHRIDRGHLWNELGRDEYSFTLLASGVGRSVASRVDPGSLARLDVPRSEIENGAAQRLQIVMGEKKLQAEIFDEHSEESVRAYYMYNRAYDSDRCYEETLREPFFMTPVTREGSRLAFFRDIGRLGRHSASPFS